MKRKFLLYVFLFAFMSISAQVADKQTYLSDFKSELIKKWPKNRTLNIVFHGHSVPTGYYRSQIVNSLQSYPHLTLHGLKTQYPYAVINVITTSIGGEQSEKGAKRFEDDVLNHKPEVLFIDYALNDRGIGLERAEKAWRQMIEKALSRNIKVILLTPTPDTRENITDNNSVLSGYANMIRKLATEYKVGLVDSYKIFYDKAKTGENISKYMSQNNHPNAAGHSAVAAEILTWFY